MSELASLHTARLLLRRIVPADLDHLYALDNDVEVMRYINGGQPTPYAVVKEELLPVFLRRDARGAAYGFWAAQTQPEGRFVGWFSLRLVDRVGARAALGYRLCRSLWGCGYATEGARALIAYGFAERRLQEVVATTYEENRASRRVMEKVGMRYVRSVRLTSGDLARADTYHSRAVDVWDGYDVEYALTRSAWERQRIGPEHYDQTKTSSSSAE